MITLTVNGKPQDLSNPTDLMTFLEAHGVQTQFMAVAHNGVILQKEELQGVILNQGDVLEIVRPVGGG